MLIYVIDGDHQDHDGSLISRFTFPGDVPKGEYVMTLRHRSERTEARVPTFKEYRARFTVGDVTTGEEDMVDSWEVAQPTG